jgi:hypothetical protein
MGSLKGREVRFMAGGLGCSKIEFKDRYGNGG